MNTTELYNRETGALSAAGMALLAGVSTETITALPSTGSGRHVPSTLIRRMQQTVDRADRAGINRNDIYALIDWLAAGEPTRTETHR